MKTDAEIVEYLKLLLPEWINLHKESEERCIKEPNIIMFNWHEGKRLMAEEVLKIVNNKD